MFEVSVCGSFVAGHQIRYPDGTLEELHQHEWKVEIGFRRTTLPPTGLVVDFVEAKNHLDRLLAMLTETNLNTHAMFTGVNPTAEHVARVIYEHLHDQMGVEAPLAWVVVEEAPGCKAWYRSSNAEE